MKNYKFTLFYRIISILLLLFLQQNIPFASETLGKSEKKKWHEKKRYAFLVGINNYQNTTELKYAVSDSREMFILLAQVGHFEKIIVLNDKDGKVIVTNGKEESRDKKYLPTKENIKETYKSILNEKPDTLLFYYSGHGFIDGKDDKNSIAPMDVEVNFVGDKAVPKNGIVLTEMANGFKTEADNDNSDIEQVIFLIDACRSPLPKVDDDEEQSSNKKELGKDKNSPQQNTNQPIKEDSSDSDNNPKSKTKFISFQNYGEDIPEIVNDAKGVVILIGTSPNEASLEDDDLRSGKFTYYIRKAISGGIQDETPAEYVTLESLELYVKKKFDLEHDEYAGFARENGDDILSKPPQAIYKVSTQRGFTGDFLISYGRPPDTEVRIERRGYLDLTEDRPVGAKVLFNKDKERYDLKFFAKGKDSEKYYPESLEGVSRIKYSFLRNGKDHLEGFEAEQFNFKEEPIFTHGLELEEESGWVLNSMYSLTEDDKKDIDKKRIRFQKQKFDFNGNNILQEYFDDSGQPVAIGEAKITKTIRAWDYNDEKTLEEFYNEKGVLTNNEFGYARYTATYLGKGKPISEEYFNANGMLSENKNGVARKTFTYDSGHKLISLQTFDKEGKLKGDTNDIAITKYIYNNACLEHIWKIESSKEIYQDIDKKTQSELMLKFNRLETFSNCIQSETYLDKFEKPIEKSNGIAKKENQFNEIGLITLEQNFRQDGRPWHKGGIFRTEYEYDEKNRIISKKFFGETRNTSLDPVPVTNEFGIHKYEYKYGTSSNGNIKIDYDKELLQRVYYYGIGGQLVSAAKGVSIEEYLYTYNRELKEYEEAVIHYLNSKEKIVRANKGNVQIQIEDKNRNILLFEALDTSQKLKDYWGGVIAYYTYSYDKQGKMTGYEYFNAKEESVEWNGISKSIYTYDKKENLARVENKNAKDLLVSQNIYKTNEKGYIISVENQDTKGNLIADEANGIAKYKYEYDLNGKVISYEQYGIDEKLKEDTVHGYAKSISKFEPGGNLVLQEYYGADGKLKDTAPGIARYVYKYDEKSNLILTETYDANEKLVNNSNGFAKIVNQSDEKGNIILTEYFDANEVKIRKEEMKFDRKDNITILEMYEGEGKFISKTIFNYDEKGNMILKKSSGADNKLISFNEKGIAKQEYSYNTKLRHKIENEFKEEWNQIRDQFIVASKEKDLKKRNQSIEKQISYWQDKFQNPMNGFLNKIDNTLGKEKSTKLGNDFIDFANKFKKELENCKLRSVSYKPDGTLIERKERFGRHRLLTSEITDENGILTSPEYHLYFHNPRGQFEKRLLHMKLDRFYRPVSLEFETRQLDIKD